MILNFTTIDLLLITFVMCAGATLQGSAGYGMALLVSPILLLIDPSFIPGPLISAAFFLTILILIREKRLIDLSGLKWATTGMILGTIVATIFISMISSDVVSIVFGFSILLAVVMSLSGVKFRPKPWAVFAASIVAGFMGIITTTSGPPLALVYQESTGGRLRSVMGGVFIIGAIVSIISLAIIDRFGLNEFLQSLLLYPGIFLGYLISSKVIKRIDDRLFRLLVLSISAVSGIIILVSYLV